MDGDHRPGRRQSKQPAGGGGGGYADVLARAGIRPPGTSTSGRTHYAALDARLVVEALQTALAVDPASPAEARAAFLAGFEAAVLDDPARLRAALAPMAVVAGVPPGLRANEGGGDGDDDTDTTPPPSPSAAGRGGAATATAGDSFVRVLLSTPCLQADVAASLLSALPALAEADDAEGAGDAGAATTHLQRLVLSQFRWLELVHDPAGLTSGLLGALDACGPDLARDIVSFLPEVAPDAEHASVVGRLEDLASTDAGLLLPALDAAAALPLSPSLSARMHDLAVGRLASVALVDLPAVVAFVLAHAGGGGAGADPAAVRAAVAAVRAALPFAAPADPRLPGIGGGGASTSASAAADARRRGKAAAVPGTDGPAARTVAAVGRALALAPAAAAAWLKAVRGAASPTDVGPLDAWALLHLRAGGGAGAVKAVDGAVSRGLGAGALTPSWLAGSVAGHGGVLLGGAGSAASAALASASSSADRGLVDAAVGLAGALLSGAGPPAASAGGAALYEALFSEFAGAPDVRQDVLRALLAHACAGLASPDEADGALGVLAAIGRTRPAALSPFSAAITGLLDHLDALTPSQAGVVFSVLAGLAVHCRGGRGGGEGGGEAGGGGGGGGGARVEDELRITLSKLSASPLAGARALGTVGTVALFRRLADAAAASGDEAGEAEWEGEAGGLARAALRGRGGRGAAGARLLDELASAAARADDSGAAFTPALDAQLRQEAEAALGALAVDTDARGGLAPGAADGLVGPPGQPPTTTIPGTAWLGLDGTDAPVALALLPCLAGAGGGRSPAVTAPAALRLFAALAARARAPDPLASVSALLGAPLALPVPACLDRAALAAAPPAARIACARAVLAAANWCRGLLGAFGCANCVDDAATAAKLAVRASAAAQLQAVLPGVMAACVGLRDATFPTLHGDERALGAMVASVGGGGGGGKKKAAPALPPGENEAPNGQDAQAAPPPPSPALQSVAAALLRPLPPSAFPAVLGVLGSHAAPDAAAVLPAAAWLVAELAEGLGHAVPALGRAGRRGPPAPPGARRGADAAPALGGGPPPLSPPPACLASPPAALVAATVDALPFIGRLLRLAAGVLASCEGGRGPARLDACVPTVCAAGAPPPPPSAIVRGLPAAEAALTDTRSAAVRVAASSLDCVRLCLAASAALPAEAGAGAAAAAFAALRGAAPPAVAGAAPTPSDAGDAAMSLAVLRLGRLVDGPAAAAAAAAAGGAAAAAHGSGSTISEDDGGPAQQLAAALADTGEGADFAVHYARVRTLGGLAAWAARAAAADGAGAGAASPLDPPPPGLADARAAWAASARAVLAEAWDSCPAPGLPAPAAHRPGAGWRGRSGPLRELVGALVSGAPAPAGAAASLAAGPLADLADRRPTPFPSLTPSSLATWYGAACDAFVSSWAPVAAAAAAAGRRAAPAGALPSGFDAHAAAATDAAGAYSSLLNLARNCPRAGALHATALRTTARFVGGGVVGSMSLWRAAAAADPAAGLAAFDAFARRLQQGTRIAQSLCGEGKARRDAGALAAAIPPARRALEAFLLCAADVCRAAAGGGGPGAGGARAAAPADLFYVGNLKPRDLAGRQVSSQAGYEDEGDSEEEEEEDDEEEGEGGEGAGGAGSGTESEDGGDDEEGQAVQRRPAKRRARPVVSDGDTAAESEECEEEGEATEAE